MTPSEFRAWFPDGEFALTSDATLTDSYIQGFLTRASTMFDVGRWGALYSEGLACYVAASIVVSKARAARALAVNNGALSSKTVGSVSASYDSQLLNRQADDTLMLTDYGRRYVELRNMIGLGGLAASDPLMVEGYFGP